MRRRAADAFGAATAHASYEALVADPEVDVVYVATPHHLHLPHALLAIAAGKHVLVEKPVGLDAAEARRIGEAAARAGVFCMEAMWTLFLPRFDVVRQLLADGVVGEPRVVLADMGEWFDDGHRIMRPSWPAGRCSTSGTYPVTLATWVLGAPDQVVAVGTPAPSGINGQLTMGLTTAAGRDGIPGGQHARRHPVGRQHHRRPGPHRPRRPVLPAGPVALTLRDGTDLRWDEPRVDHAGLHFEAAEVARRITAGETGSPLRPWADTVATLEVMDRVRAEAGIDFAAAVAAREGRDRG